MVNTDELYQNQILELRRGSIVLAIVSVLHRQEYYGYSLLKALEKYAFLVEGNTLYPMLRRLQAQGIVTSRWDTTDSRPRKYYSLTPEGEALYHKLVAEWSNMNKTVNLIIKENS